MQKEKAGCGNPKITATPTVARNKSASIATAVCATTPGAQRFRLCIALRQSPESVIFRRRHDYMRRGSCDVNP